MMRTCLLFTFLVALQGVHAFAPQPRRAGFVSQTFSSSGLIVLQAAKKRKRKQAPGTPGSATESTSASIPGLTDENAEDGALSEDDIAAMKDVANFEFKPDDAIAMGMYDTHQQRIHHIALTFIVS
jgi:hypothetical protein